MNRTTRPTAAEVRHDEVHPIDEPPPWDGEDIDPAWWHELDAAAEADDGGEEWGWDDRISLADDAPVDGDALKLADWLSGEASYYTATKTPQGRWLAGELTELARQARELDARTVETFNSRREQAECSRAEDLIHAGYVRGLADGRAEGPGLPYGFGHSA